MNRLEITRRVEALRNYMREHALAAFIFPSTDPHNGEYVPEHWMTRQWISGFNGSAGTAVVTLTDAALWTDSRYFLAATEQLEGTPFQLMRERIPGTPSRSGASAAAARATARTSQARMATPHFGKLIHPIL